MADIIDLTEDDSPPQRRRGGAKRPAEVISLLDDEEEDAAPSGGRGGAGGGAGGSAPKASRRDGGARAPAEQLPPWHGTHGTKRVLMEFQALARACACADSGPVYGLDLPDESDLCRWRFRMRGFDADLPGGAALNADLARLGVEYGQDYLLLEARFPADYPSRPFALRLVSPRCAWYTGHVTAGGSVCTEALAQTGGPNAWQPSYSVHGILELIKNAMVTVEPVMVRTATGPGGLAGPLRIDFERKWHPTRTPLEPYSEAEAVAAFARAEAHHRANGW